MNAQPGADRPGDDAADRFSAAPDRSTERDAGTSAAGTPAGSPTAGTPAAPSAPSAPAAPYWGRQSEQDTGPIRTTGAHPGGSSPAAGSSGDHAWWQPRPSGALTDPSWSGAGQQSRPYDTRSYPVAGGGYLPPVGGAPGYAAGQPAPGGTAVLDRPTRTGRRTTTLAIGAVIALAAGFGGGVVGANLGSSNTSVDNSLSRSAQSSTVSAQLPAPTGSVQQVASAVLPSVVSVLSTSSSSQGEGSGVILSGDGLILTNNHVIEGATTLQVRFNDGTTADATVVGADATDDLAVIKAENVSGLTTATLGSSDNLQVGQQVVAIGSPLGLSATVTSGIVSALDRPVRTGSAQQTQSTAQDTVMNAIQTDAAINPGNSGGALVDMNGAVIGINSAIASTSTTSGEAGNIGVGFAIPIDQAKRIAQEIVDTGKATHAVLGASVTDAATRTQASGATLSQLTSGGGAEQAGLQAGDVVTKVGDQLVETADALVAAIRSSAPGGTVPITYVRDGQTETVTVTLGSATSN
ncbi:hypothetical protein GCM10009818_21750 [Nakamurella flavida]